MDTTLPIDAVTTFRRPRFDRVAITSVFFLIADQIMRLVVTFLLGIGS